MTCFASNLARVESIALAAVAAGRHPVLSGRALARMVEAARECGYLLDFPPTILLTTSTAQRFTVTNTGTAATAALAVALGGTNPTDFAVVTGADTCTGTLLAVSATCTVDAAFAPTLQGRAHQPHPGDGLRRHVGHRDPQRHGHQHEHGQRLPDQ